MASINAGTVISIVSGTPATWDQAGVEALTYTEIGSVESIGQIGGNSNIITGVPLDKIVPLKFKGVHDPGDPQVVLFKDATDAGQVVLQAGSAPENQDVHTARIQYLDGPGATISTSQYFKCLVAGYPTDPGNVENIVRATVTLAITEDVPLEIVV